VAPVQVADGSAHVAHRAVDHVPDQPAAQIIDHDRDAAAAAPRWHSPLFGSVVFGRTAQKARTIASEQWVEAGLVAVLNMT